jgi:hypothetical protein
MAVSTVEARERNVVETRRKFQSISETVIKIHLSHKVAIAVYGISQRNVSLCV